MIKKITLILWGLFLAIFPPIAFYDSSVNRFLIINTTSEEGANAVEQTLRPRLERISGTATQFGTLGSFLRFEFQTSGKTLGKFITDNPYVNSAVAWEKEGAVDISQCVSKNESSLSIAELKNELNIFQQGITEECLKKTLGVNDEYVRTGFKITNYPSIAIYPDLASSLVMFIVILVTWNTILLLIFNVIKSFRDFFEKA